MDEIGCQSTTCPNFNSSTGKEFCENIERDFEKVLNFMIENEKNLKDIDQVKPVLNNLEKLHNEYNRQQIEQVQTGSQEFPINCRSNEF